jgi:demethylmenaquinone methyltransferase/2-methoxy-6-polyprenyl-1,4-benzoquinol methylase
VTGVDIAPAMLGLAGQRVREDGLDDLVSLRELGAVDLDVAFEDRSFDAVTSSLMFSELSEDEIEYTLAECHRVLRPGGSLLIADEVLPESVLGRIGTFVLRLPFVLLAFLLTQTTTHRVAGLEAMIEAAGFRIRNIEHYLAGTLRLFVADKGKAHVD